MALTDRADQLRRIDLFADFSSEQLVELAGHIVERCYPAGHILCREGDAGDEMFILLKGRLRVFKDRRTIVSITPVDYVGEMAIIEERPRSAGVEVVEDSLLLVLAASQFHEYLARQPGCLVSLMRNLSRRIRQDTELLAREFEKANILIHDMRNTLSVFVFLDSLEKVAPDECALKKLRFMQRARQDLARMMEEALANAKRLRYEPHRQQGNIAELVRELATSLQATHPDLTDKELVCSAAADLPDSTFDPAAIRRVLANLLINAGQASDAGGRISVSTEYGEGDGIVIRIRDHGHGIAPDIMDRIFLPHFTTRPNGNGLGLASCRQIIEQEHGGTIEVASRPGQGAEFTVRLPLADRGVDGG